MYMCTCTSCVVICVSDQQFRVPHKHFNGNQAMEFKESKRNPGLLSPEAIKINFLDSSAHVNANHETQTYLSFACSVV